MYRFGVAISRHITLFSLIYLSLSLSLSPTLSLSPYLALSLFHLLSISQYFLHSDNYLIQSMLHLAQTNESTSPLSLVEQLQKK